MLEILLDLAIDEAGTCATGTDPPGPKTARIPRPPPSPRAPTGDIQTQNCSGSINSKSISVTSMPHIHVFLFLMIFVLMCQVLVEYYFLYVPLIPCPRRCFVPLSRRCLRKIVLVP